MKESVIYQEIQSIGEAEGIAEGEAKGEAKLILKQLQRRFGDHEVAMLCIDRLS